MNGQCLCGKIKFEVEILNHEVHACHCSMCRRQTSGILMSIDIKPESLKIHDDSSLSIFDSSEWGERGFCKACGTSLFWRLKNNEYANVNVFALDTPRHDFQLVTEIYIDHKPAFYAFSNFTQQLTEADIVALMKTE